MGHKLANIDLNGQWELYCAEYGTGEQKIINCTGVPQVEWMECHVPGDIHNALVSNGIIENPLTGSNFEKYLWTEDKEWWYKKEFTICPDFYENIKDSKWDRRAEIVFHGLDLNAKIWLNGIEIGSHQNAFISCTFDVTNTLISGVNTLYVRLDCGLKSLEGIDHSRYEYGVALPYETDIRRVCLRKPQFSFRWDWAQRLITCGIWRSVEINFYNLAVIRDLYIKSSINEDGSADVLITCSVESFKKGIEQTTNENIGGYELICRVSDGDKVSQYNCAANQDRSGLCDAASYYPYMEFTQAVHINHPKCWWPAGYGEPFLYDVEVCLIKDDKVIDVKNCRYGIKSVKLLQEFISKEEGTSFTLEVNGHRVFCKGANWIPADSITANVTSEKYRTLISMARDANFNMLRVWGGGIYEDPYFYELCDELGIMVWQDFMFACAFYPDDATDFVKSIAHEAESVVKALRNHACMVLWCGNNEIAWNYETLRDKHPHFYGRKLYEDTILNICEKLCPEVPYISSTPFGTKEVNGELEGDTHSWDFWMGEDKDKRIDYHIFSRNKSKFCSEYGVMGPPVLESIREYTPYEQLYRGSQVWNMHNNCYELGLTDQILDKYFCNVKVLNFEDYLKYAQMMQAEIYAYSIEHFRRRKFKCSGVMFWMYNDCWGTNGWSIVDYYSRPKPSYYFVKRAYKPVIVSAERNSENGVSICICNDTLNDLECTLEYGLARFDAQISNYMYGSESYNTYDDCFGDIKCKKIIKTLVKANTSQEVGSNLYSDVSMNDIYCYARLLDANNELIDETQIFFVEYKELFLPKTALTWEFHAIEGNACQVTIKTTNYASFVNINVPDGITLSDNYFDMQGGQERRITMIDHSNSIEKLTKEMINITCINHLE